MIYDQRVLPVFSTQKKPLHSLQITLFVNNKIEIFFVFLYGWNYKKNMNKYDVIVHKNW